MSVGSGDLLIVSDTGNIEKELVNSLEDGGYSVLFAAANFCLPAIKKNNPDVLILSLESAAFDARSLLDCVLLLDNDLPVVLLTNAGNDALILPLLEQGAYNFCTVGTGADAGLLRHIVSSAICQRKLRVQNRALKNNLQVLELDQLPGYRVQTRLLPASPARLGPFDLAHLIRPSLILSGDSVNYFQLEDRRVLFYLADVSGHGAAGAMVTVALSGLSRRLAFDYSRLNLETSADILGWFNQELLRLNLEQHITMFLGILDDKKQILQYSNAAHFPAAILNNNKATRFLEVGGLPLGVCDTEYEFKDVTISENFKMVIFSDGVLEIMPQKSIKQKEEALFSLVQCGNTEIQQLVDHLGLDDIKDVPDDIAFFTVARMSLSL